MFGKKFRSFGRRSLYRGVILGWGETEVSYYPVGFQASRQLAREFGEMIDSCWRWDYRCHPNVIVDRN